MKNFLIAMGIFLIGMFLMTTTMKVYASDEVPNEVVEEKTGKVIEDISQGGEVLFDITEGKVGEYVTALVKPDFLYSVVSVSINGEEYAELSEDGQYKFYLVEGDNVFKVVFKVDNEKLQEITDLINGVKKNGIESVLNINNLLNVITWFISIFISSGFFLTLIKNKKIKTQTTEQIVDLVTKIVKDENSKAIVDFLENVLGTSMDKITQKMDGVDECIKVLCRCFVLAQDDTPENRLAIIEELTKLQNNDEALTNQIKAIIKQEQEAQKQAIIDRDEALKALKEDNENLITNNSDNDDGNKYGQL